MESSLREEKLKIERGAFIETMSFIFQELRSGQISSSEFMRGMEACSEMTKIDFRFAYDYLNAELIKLAPEMAVDDYSKATTSICRMASFMHRFEIPNSKLQSLQEIAQQQYPNCKADK